MKFTTPCFVRVENAAKRKELKEWLKEIGYRVCVCTTFYRNNTIRCIMIDRNGTLCPEVHAIPDIDIDGECGLEQFLYENSKSDNPSYNCGNNIEMFKALAAMNDENDNEQWFIGKNGFMMRGRRGLDEHTFNKIFRKATANEIVEYFKKREK